MCFFPLSMWDYIEQTILGRNIPAVFYLYCKFHTTKQLIIWTVCDVKKHLGNPAEDLSSSRSCGEPRKSISLKLNVVQFCTDDSMF